MTRQPRQSNPLGVAITVAGTIFLAAFVLLIRHPELIGWLVAVYVTCALLGVGLVAAEAREEAKGLRDQLRAEREAAEAQRADVVRVPLLRVVPTQRQPTHDVYDQEADR